MIRKKIIFFFGGGVRSGDWGVFQVQGGGGVQGGGFDFFLGGGWVDVNREVKFL